MQTELIFNRGGLASCLRACFDVSMLLPQTNYYQYPDLSEGAGSIDGQVHGDKECPFSGI